MNTLFSSLSLRPELLGALEQLEFKQMTAIQVAALPVLLKGEDVIGRAKTGSGKTAAFGIALLNGIVTERIETQALVLCPTRELVEQVAAELRRLAQKMSNTRVVTLCGGHSFHDQKVALKGRCQVVVATPGRLGAHLRKGTLNLQTVQFLILDEADRMLDMGFIDEVKSIVERCPADRQTLLFSATFPDQIGKLSSSIQKNAKMIEVESVVANEQLHQEVLFCETGERRGLVASVLASKKPSSALIFCETRDDVERMASLLKSRGASVSALHGLMEQRDRDEALMRFANGSLSVLVATNVAARGLDVPALPLVIVSELSRDAASHLHRIGRTGRADESGIAVSIVCGTYERHRLKTIEEELGQSMERAAKPPTANGLQFLKPRFKTLILLAGKKDKLRKGDIVGALIKDAKIPSGAIGNIHLMPKKCAVAIERRYAEQALSYLRTGRIKKKKVRALLLR